MKFIVACCVLVSVCVVNVSEVPGRERKPVRLIAEAEDFEIKSDGWQVVPYRENYFASTFAVSFLSRMACLGAPEQLDDGQVAIAEQVVQIPYDDQFELLTRYEQPYNFSAEFTVEVEQGGRVVAAFPCGRLTDNRIWPFNGHQRKPMERFWWGGTDNIVWQQPGSVKLKKGQAIVRLKAGGQNMGGKPRINAGKRNIDVVMLTNDREGMATQKAKARYLEFDGWLVQDGDLFVKVTNPKDGPGACVPVIEAQRGGEHSPYYIHVRDWAATYITKSGHVVQATAYANDGPRSRSVNARGLSPSLDVAAYTQPKNPKNLKAGTKVVIPEAEYLPPGGSSGWVPMGQVIDALHNMKWTPTAIYGGRKTADVHLDLEFAIPDGRGGLKSIKKARVRGKRTTFEMPGNVAPNPAVASALKDRFWLPVIRTQKEAVDWLLSEVRKFPKIGKRPDRFLIYNIMGFGGRSFDDPAVRELALALGDNTYFGGEGKKRSLVAHWRNPNPEAIDKQAAKHKGGFDDLLVVSYGDEIHLPADPVTDEEFVAWLKQRGVAVDGPVKFTKSKDDPLYYYSQICSKEKGGKRYAVGTAYYKSKGIRTGANYSPHSNYLVSELDYIRTFKIRAMSLPWSEDYIWQIPEFSVQAMGYLTSGLRAGAKYDNLPIHMYVMPHSPGNTPRDFRLSFYTAIAHGAKHINYFCASPLAIGSTENYIATDDLGMWRQVHDCSHEAGVFEDYVVDGTVKQAKVGLLLSSVDDVWLGVKNSTLALHNNERKAIYYALRHSQVPVDFISEDDVIDGRADDYQLIYVTQQWLHSKAVKALTRWVSDGGTLVALAGGGFKNEFNQLNPEVNGLYGVESQQLSTDPQLVSKYLLEENRPFLTKQDLPLYEAMDKVTWSNSGQSVSGVEVVAWKQTIAASDSTVIGRFRDGGPAVVTKAIGTGRTYLFGFLPGQAYLKGGLRIAPPDRGSVDEANAHFLPTDMDANLRRRMVDDFLGESYVRPVECDAALVESTTIVTPAIAGKPARIAVPLMNYTGKPIDRMTVRIKGLGKAKAVRSVQHGRLRFEVVDGDTVVKIPLDIADMLLVDKSK